MIQHEKSGMPMVFGVYSNMYSRFLSEIECVINRGLKRKTKEKG